MWQFNDVSGGLSWPSVSFAILVGSLLLTGFVLWRRFRSRRLLLQRVAELEKLSASGRAIVTAELHVTALCQLIAREFGGIVDNRDFQVGLFEGECYEILFWSADGRQLETPRTIECDDDASALGWVRARKQPLLVKDFLKETTNLRADCGQFSASPPLSAIYIPLISGDQVIGVVSAHSDEPDHFGEDDLRRLMILSNQAAAALAHAKLLEQAQKRAVYLQLVGQIARQINVNLSREEIFAQVVRLINQTFNFHPVSILGMGDDGQSLAIQSSTYEVPAGQLLRIALGQGITGTAAASKETIVSNNTTEDIRFLDRIPGNPYTSVGTKAEMAVPLVVGGQVLGVLDVQSPQEGAFTAAEITALETLAAEVAIAIDKALQLAQQREQAWATTAQLQVAEAIDRDADLDSIIATIARLTTMLVGISQCGILLWDEESERYGGGAYYGPNTDYSESFARQRLPIGAWGALDAVHVGQQPLTTHLPAPWLGTANTVQRQAVTPLTLLPISNKERIFGVMVIDALESRTPARHPWSNSPNMMRQELLSNIIRQTTLAIESAQLRLAQQEEAWVNTALLQVAEAVNNLTDLNEILDTIVRLVPLLVGIRSVLVMIRDEEQRSYRAGPSYGISDMGRGLLEIQGIDEQEFLSISTGSGDFLTPTTLYYSLRLPPWLVKVLGTSIAHAFPLHARGRVVGVMLVGTSQEDGRALSVRRLNILNGIAHQAATAVVNNRLYLESAERNRLEQELDVARGIQASLIPAGSPDIPGCTVASFWQAARQVSGDFYDFLRFPDDSWGILIADVADKGVPAALFMTLCRTILRTVAFNRRDPADVLMRANQLIDQDAQSELFVTVFFANWDPIEGTLTYANAGHNPPILLRRNGQIRPLKGTGMALGVLPSVRISSRSLEMRGGDTLLLYTDGVTEAMNEDLDEFGLARLQMAATAARRMDATGIMQNITRSINVHVGETPQSDDITLVIMKRGRS